MRMVAGENLQRDGFDFDTVYAPIVGFSFTLLKLFLCLSDCRKVQHVDVKAAFLNGDIDREFLCTTHIMFQLTLVGVLYTSFIKHSMASN